GRPRGLARRRRRACVRDDEAARRVERGGRRAELSIPVRILLLFASGAASRTLSYQQGWPRQLARHPRFECVAFNLRDRVDRLRLRALGRRLVRRVDAVVMLHSIFSNELVLDDRLVELLAGAPAPRAFFIGNEY